MQLPPSQPKNASVAQFFCIPLICCFSQEEERSEERNLKSKTCLEIVSIRGEKSSHRIYFCDADEEREEEGDKT